MFRTAFCASVIALIVGGGLPYADTSDAAAGGCAGASAVPNDGAGRTLAARSVVCLVNRRRAALGLRALRLSGPLTVAAGGHSADMVAHGYFGHVSPAGDTLATRVQRAGYAATHPRYAVGEALAWGRQATPSVLVQALMRSPAHRGVLLNPGAREVGIGLTLGAPAAGVPGPCSTVVLNVGS